MSILNAIANPKIADVQGEFEKGRQIGQQKLTKDLAGEILNETLGSKLGMQAYQDLQRVNPEAAMNLKKAIQTDSDSGTQYFLGLTKAAASIIDQGGTAEDVAKYLGPQIMLAQKAGQIGIAQRLADTVPMLMNPETAPEVMRNIKATNAGFSDTKAGTSEREFNNLIADFTPKEQAKAKRVKAGLEGRASSNALQTAIDAGPGALKEYLDAVGSESGSKKAGDAAIARSEKAFDSVEKIKTSISNIDEGIRLLDEGAETGPIMALLPSVRSTAVQLDNLQSRLGLDVIGNTTFGALSQSELEFALKTALPKNLEPKDLRAWLVKKKESQTKLAGYLTEVAQFLGTPGNTTADWLELQSVRQLESEQQSQLDTQAPVDLTTLSMEELQELRKGAQ